MPNTCAVRVTLFFKYETLLATLPDIAKVRS